MKERPILFSGPMVLAILDGRKTMTRRILNPQPHEDYGSLCGPSYYEPTIIGRIGEEREGPEVYGVYSDDGEWGIKCPFEPGMRLWVRETWCEYGKGNAIYRADYGSFTPISDGIGGPWKPSIFMPRWASRITLEITDVRVQRIQDISEADGQAEGVQRLELTSGIIEGIDPPFNRVHPLTSSYADAFHALWDSINGKTHPWASNPWVWAITFKRLEAA